MHTPGLNCLSFKRRNSQGGFSRTARGTHEISEGRAARERCEPKTNVFVHSEVSCGGKHPISKGGQLFSSQPEKARNQKCMFSFTAWRAVGENVRFGECGKGTERREPGKECNGWKRTFSPTAWRAVGENAGFGVCGCMHDFCVISVWFQYDSCMIYVWFLYNACTYNLCMISIWCMYDLCMILMGVEGRYAWPALPRPLIHKSYKIIHKSYISHTEIIHKSYRNYW